MISKWDVGHVVYVILMAGVGAGLFFLLYKLTGEKTLAMLGYFGFCVGVLHRRIMQLRQKH